MRLGLLCACVALLASLVAPARATNLFGETGLVFIPTADEVRRGDYSVGINGVGYGYRQYNAHYHSANVLHYFHLGLMPRLDVTFGVVNLQGRLFGQYHDPLTDPLSTGPKGNVGGWNIDKVASARFLLTPQHGMWPAMAIGVRDPIGTGSYGAAYLVATRRWTVGSGLGIHLGVGRKLKIHTAPSPLDGVFGGVDYWAHPRLGLMLETTQDSVNFGARIRLTKHFELQPALMGMNQIAGGVAFSSRM